MMTTGTRTISGRRYLPVGSSPTKNQGVLGSDGNPAQESLKRQEIAGGGKPFESGAYKSSLRSAEDSIRGNNGFETGIVLDGNGKQIIRKQGDGRSVSFSNDDVAQMRGQVLTHNHPIIDANPYGHSFSPADAALVAYSGLREIRAVTSAGMEYSFRQSTVVPDFEKKTPRKRESMIRSAYTSEDKKLRGQMFPLISQGRLTRQDADTAHWHIVNKRVAGRSSNPYSYTVSGPKDALANLDRIERIVNGAQ